jgi:peptide/nickel transport system substrate-binding protein
LVLPGEPGHIGGRLVVSLRGEPKTLNPLIAADARSREAIGVMQADLVHINRATQLTEPALAKSWKISPDGLAYTLVLRKGIKFSDGQPFDADDVLFTFRVYLDENVHAPQRDLLIVGGKPIAVRKVDPQTVVFQLAKTYGVGERLFDGMAILPVICEKPYQEGKLGQIGSLATAANNGGTRPISSEKDVAGQRAGLGRNPCYWKSDTKGNRLPAMSMNLCFCSCQTRMRRFWLIGRDRCNQPTGRRNFSVLSSQGSYRMVDAGLGSNTTFSFST